MADTPSVILKITNGVASGPYVMSTSQSGDVCTAEVFAYSDPTITAPEISGKIFTGWTTTISDATITDPTSRETTITVKLTGGIVTANYIDKNRKFLDILGLTTLVNNIKTLLTGKQDTLTQGSNITISGNTISATDTTYDNATTSAAGLMSAADKTKLDNTFKELTSPVQIWDLSDGVYQLPKSCQVYYGGSTYDANKMFTVYTPSLLWVTHYNSTYKHFFIFYGDTSTYRYIRNGYATSSNGSYDTLTFGGNSYLRSISNYVKNNLTYSTSSTTYALSAYQGYLLNQNKADKTEIPTKTSDLTNDSGFLTSHQDISGKEDNSNKVTSISSSSTDTQYPSAKCVYDLVGNVESILQTLNSGTGV